MERCHQKPSRSNGESSPKVLERCHHWWHLGVQLQYTAMAFKAVDRVCWNSWLGKPLEPHTPKNTGWNPIPQRMSG